MAIERLRNIPRLQYSFIFFILGSIIIIAVLLNDSALRPSERNNVKHPGLERK